MLVLVIKAEVKGDVGAEPSVFFTERVGFQLPWVGSPEGAVWEAEEEVYGLRGG